MVKPHRDLSPEQFQRRCLEGCARILGPHWVPGDLFQQVVGRTPYWKAKGSVGGHSVEVFIYDNQAEFGIDGKWTICEWPDFDNLEDLVKKFLARLEAATAGLKQAPPPTS